MSGQKLVRGNRFANAIVAAAAAVVIGSCSIVNAAAAPPPEKLNVAPSTHWFADWQESTAPAPADIFATPNANNSNYASFVQPNLTGSAGVGKPLGIKVYQGNLNSTTAAQLFNSTYGGKAISYVFGDFETGPATQHISDTLNLSNQVRAGTQAKNAYVGEFALVPLNGTTGGSFENGYDLMRRGPLPYTKSQYTSAKVNMANTDLYPGSPSYRNKSTFDWGNANIRTGLFVGPIG